MSITDGLTLVTHFVDNNEGSFNSHHQISPIPGSVAKEIITNYNGECDIEDLFGINVFVGDSALYSLCYDNDFYDKI